MCIREAFIKKREYIKTFYLKEGGGQLENLIIQKWKIRTFRSRGKGWKSECPNFCQIWSGILEQLFMWLSLNLTNFCMILMQDGKLYPKNLKFLYYVSVIYPSTPPSP